jgi:preprotein translocase subunit SecG
VPIGVCVDVLIEPATGGDIGGAIGGNNESGGDKSTAVSTVIIGNGCWGAAREVHAISC